MKKNVPITKRISDDQSFEYQKNGKGIVTKYFWFGEDWMRFAKMLAKYELEQHVMNYFLGATLSPIDRTVTMRNAFAFDHWKDRFAPRITDWAFSWGGQKALKLPHGAEEYDTLAYHVNGAPLAEYWNGWIEAYSKPAGDAPKLLL